jgi:hypothetical protein
MDPCWMVAHAAFCRHSVTLLAAALLHACMRPTPPPPREQPTSSARPTAASLSSAAKVPPWKATPAAPPLQDAAAVARAAALEQLLEAGRTQALGLNRFDEQTVDQYKAIGRTLGVPEESLGGTLYSVIMRSLSHVGERSLLRDWAMSPSAIPIQRLQALVVLQQPSSISELGRRFEPEDVPMLDSMLDFDVWSTQIELVATPPLLRPVLNRQAIACNFHGTLLASLSAIDSDAARAALQRISEDKARTAPNPETLSTLGCAPGHRDDSLAMALASERWLALVMLGDRAALRAASVEPNAPAFFRKWCALAAEQKPYFKAPPGGDSDDPFEVLRWSAPCRLP